MVVMRHDPLLDLETVVNLKESRLHDMKETTREMAFIYDELDQSGIP